MASSVCGSPVPELQGKDANADVMRSQLDRLVGLVMLIVATTVFTYYTVWTLLMV